MIKDALAVYRLTKLALDDEITQPLREKIFKKQPPTPDKPSYILVCPWCFSIWGAAALLAGKAVLPRATEVVTDILALSAVTGIAYEKL